MTTLTKTDIANFALAHIGDHRVTNIDSDTKPNSIKVRDQWDITRLEALSAYEWGFASTMRELALASEMPAIEYDYAHDKPVDWVRTNWLSPSSSFPRDAPFRRWADKAGQIWSNEQTLFMDYVYDHTTVGAWPPWFVDYMSLSLAMRINPGITTSKQTGEALYDMRKNALAIAKARDAQTQPIRYPAPGSWVRARRGRLGSARSRALYGRY